MRVLENPSPNVWIWTRNIPAGAERDIRRVVPLVIPQLTGRPYTGRIESGPRNRNWKGWITIEFDSVEVIGAVGRARVGADPGRMWLADDALWHFGPGRRPQHWRFEAIFGHELGHAMGFWHVSDAQALMKHSNRAPAVGKFSAKERYHAQLAYEVGRGARYCGWPFGGGCGVG